MPVTPMGGEEVRASQEDARTSGSNPEAAEVVVRSREIARFTMQYNRVGVPVRVITMTDGRRYATELPVEQRRDGTSLIRHVSGWTQESGPWRVTAADFNVTDGMNVAYTIEPCSCEECQRPTLSRLFTRGASRLFANRDAEQMLRADGERMLRTTAERQAAVRQAYAGRMAAAQRRAEETLRSILLPKELAEYEKTGRVVVTGADKRRYHIGPGIVSNVTLLNKQGEAVAALCCHPDMHPPASDGQIGSDALPYRDAHVAQVLWLRHDLKNFWKTANVEWFSHTARERYYALMRGVLF